MRLLGLLFLFGCNGMAESQEKGSIDLVAKNSHTYLTVRDITIIQTNWKDYKWAAEKSDVPVEILPAIHYREADLYPGYYSASRKKWIHNVGGPFMLDLGPQDDHKAFHANIRAYEKMVYTHYKLTSPIPKVSHDFRFASLCAAHHLKEKRRGSTWNDETLADAVWGYNGRASWVPMSKSPYLWSDPKSGHKLISYYKKRGGSVSSDLDKRPGVMILYKEIKESMNFH